jgi:hypothetical protein
MASSEAADVFMTAAIAAWADPFATAKMAAASQSADFALAHNAPSIISRR